MEFFCRAPIFSRASIVKTAFPIDVIMLQLGTSSQFIQQPGARFEYLYSPAHADSNKFKISSTTTSIK